MYRWITNGMSKLSRRTSVKTKEKIIGRKEMSNKLLAQRVIKIDSSFEKNIL
jgi:hypothetical protein